MEKKKPIFKTNSFRLLALRYSDPNSTYDVREIETHDLTDLFWKEIEQYIIRGEKIKGTTLGVVREGKSTSAFAIGEGILNTVVKYKLREEDYKFSERNICRDQEEYHNIVRKIDKFHDVFIIDEDNSMVRTGENASITQAMLDDISNVMAGMYVHTWFCSPQTLADPTSDIILEVIATDHDNMLTRCILKYRLLGERGIVTLGHVDIDVSRILKNWIGKGLKDIFYKNDRTKKEEEKLEYWRKRDWYVRYVMRKHDKIKLSLNEGVQNARKIENADVILKVLNKLEKLAKAGYINRSGIKNAIQTEFFSRGIHQSIFSKELLTAEIEGILTSQIWINDMKGKIQKLRDRMINHKIKPEEYNEKREILEEALNEAWNQYNENKARMDKLVELKERYEN